MRKRVLITCLLVLSLAPASAQVSDVVTMQAVPACITTSNQAVTNLVACGVKFTPLGEIRFGVKNLGTVAVNPP